MLAPHKVIFRQQKNNLFLQFHLYFLRTCGCRDNAQKIAAYAGIRVTALFTGKMMDRAASVVTPLARPWAIVYEWEKWNRLWPLPGVHNPG